MDKKMKKYIFFNSGTKAGETLFNDFYHFENTQMFSSAVDIKNKFLKTLYKIHNSYRINRKFKLPFRNIWKKRYNLEKIDFNSGDEYFIGFTNASVVKYTIKYLNRLAEKPNVSLFLICLDSCVDKLLFPLEYLKKVNFKKIFCFEEKTAKEYNLEFCMSYYSKLPVQTKETQTDLVFVGASKGRKDFLLKLHDYFSDNGVKSYFKIYDTGEKPNEIFFNQKMEYQSIVNFTNASNCILEVVQQGQSGRTLRYYEAICYNKKLLTNNKEIFNLPYFNPQYMKYFETVDDIDVEWVKEKEDINYAYKGEFSPIELLKKM